MKMARTMGLTVKLAFVFLFFSLVLFGFDQETPQASHAPPLAASASPKEALAVQTGTFPDKIKESSGLEETGKEGVYYTHNDAGNEAVLFKVNAKGQVQASLPVAGAENIDWEDLTRDSEGNIYIADTGDNDNERKKLTIYKLAKGDPENVSLITFTYSDRQVGKNAKVRPAYDCEAIFWYRSKLYLVTKDREKALEARIYELADTPGEHEAIPVAHYPVKAAITAADISPDGKTLMLLSVGKVHLFQVAGNNFFGSDMVTRSLGKVGQTEGAVFTGNHSLAISSENGGLYRFEL